MRLTEQGKFVRCVLVTMMVAVTPLTISELYSHGSQCEHELVRVAVDGGATFKLLCK